MVVTGQWISAARALMVLRLWILIGSGNQSLPKKGYRESLNPAHSGFIKSKNDEVSECAMMYGM